MALLWNDAAAPDEALNSLSNLEERIAHAVQSLNSLRSENQALREQLAQERASHQAAAEQANEHRTLADQDLENLKAERRQVKSRIEKLLGQLEGLGQ
jgi:FtsZ-binding cell division protein ZapB